MVSSTSALSIFPVCADNSDSPPAASPEAGREPDNALSFASRLDQWRSQSEADKTARRPQSRLPDTEADTREVQSDSDTSDAPDVFASASEATAKTADAEPSEEISGISDDAGDKEEKDRIDKAATPASAVLAPLTPDALNSPAFLAAIAAAPIAAAIPTAATTVTPVTPSGNTQVIAVVPANDKLASATTGVATPPVAGANGANVTPTTQGVTPIIPPVAMDSRAALNATPGVDNASPLASNLLSALTPLVPSVAKGNANLAAAITPNVSGGAVPNTPTPPNRNTSALPIAEAGAQNNPATGNTVNNSGGANAAIGAQPVPSGTSQLPVTSPISISQAATVPPPGKEQVTVTFPADTSAKNVAQTPAALEQTGVSGQDNQPAQPSGKQNLGGIERLLTLSNARTASSAVEDAKQTGAAKSGTPTDAGAQPVAAPQIDTTQNASSSATRFAAESSLTGRPGVPAAGNPAQSGTPAPTATAATTQTATPLTLASADLDSVGKPGVAAQALHGLTGTPGLPISSPTSNSQGGIGIAGENGFASLAQASTLADSDAGEQNGQGDTQSSGNEPAFAAETRTAKTTDAASSASFAVTRASEDIAAPAQSASTGNTSQVDRAHVVEQVTRHLETMRLTNDSGEMRLRLNPHNLGSVQVTIAAHQDGVVARIAVESAQVQQVMEGAKEHLRAGLEARGLRVQSVEVTVTPNMLGDNSAAFSGQRNWQTAGAQDGAAWQSGYGRQTSPPIEAVPLAAPAAYASRAALPDSRLDCRA